VAAVVPISHARVDASDFLRRQLPHPDVYKTIQRCSKVCGLGSPEAPYLASQRRYECPGMQIPGCDLPRTQIPDVGE
jgi:hypothetical protein